MINTLPIFQSNPRGFFIMLHPLKGAAILMKQSFGKVELGNGSRPFKLYGKRYNTN